MQSCFFVKDLRRWSGCRTHRKNINPMNRFHTSFLVWRDVNYAMGFVVQLLMYAAPVVYPASRVSQAVRLLCGVFPMAGVIEGFRAALLGTIPMPWDLLAVGTLTAIVVFVSGAIYFRKMERIFADVV